MRYRVRIGEKTYELEVEDNHSQLKLYLDGKPVDFDYEIIHESGLYSLILGGKHYRIWVENQKNGTYLLKLNQKSISAEVENERQALRRLLTPRKGGGGTAAVVKAPMPGMVLRIDARQGQTVAMGQGLAVIEAMKMENEIRSPVEGVVKKIHIQQGQAVEKGAPLFEITPSA